jgi:hypothetical protein
MSHPTNEEWGLYVFGEAPPELSRKLKSHLSQCPVCAAEVQAMERTITRLDAWEVTPAHRSASSLQPALRWAMAALLVLGIGIGLGRLMSPQPFNPEQLRSELTASLLADLQKAVDQLSDDCNSLVAAAELRWADQTTVSLRALGRELIESVNDGRARDQRAIHAVLDQLKQERDADYVSLRRDLETVAASTDQQLQQARLKLFELAVNSTSKE